MIFVKQYGYVRVSTKEQNIQRQLIAFKELKVDYIYMDKQSGKDFDRPEYKKMIRKIRKGDLIYVKSIDRLGRNYEEIIEQWKIITKEKGADIIVLDMPILDTKTNKDLLGTLISDLVLQLLSFVAEMERESIKTRQAEGIAAAKEMGKRWGNVEKKLPDNFSDLHKKWQNKEITAVQLAKMCNIHRSTLYRKLKLEEERTDTNSII